MSQETRDKIKAKIKALLSRTTDRGCTEAEASSAAERASALMREHDLAYDDIEQVKSERYGARKRDVNCNIKRRSKHEVSAVAKAIAKLFHCQSWTNLDDNVRIFFGTEHDTEAAHNLCDLIALAMETEFKAYLRDPDRDNWNMHGRTIRPSFMQGMADRLNERINDICIMREAADANHQAATTGLSTALVTITKQQLMREKFVQYAKDQGLVLRKGYSGPIKRYSTHAMGAGREAANRTDLGGSKLAGNRKLIGR